MWLRLESEDAGQIANGERADEQSGLLSNLSLYANRVALMLPPLSHSSLASGIAFLSWLQPYDKTEQRRQSQAVKAALRGVR